MSHVCVRRTSSILAIVTLAILLSGSQPSAQAPPPFYALTDLGTLGRDSGWSSLPSRVSETGTVIGGALTTLSPWYHPFVYRNGVMEDIFNPDFGNGSWDPLGINSAEHVVGAFYDVDTNTSYGFLYDGVQMINLQAFGMVGSALDINDDGHIVGEHFDGDKTRAVLLQDGQLIDLGTLGGLNSGATGLNNAGQIIGVANTDAGAGHAFLYENGVMTSLGTLGSTSSYATAINESGQIVGASPSADLTNHAFLYQNRVMTQLAGDGWSAATDINNAGVIVGVTLSGAARWENGVLTDLNTLIDPASGWFLEFATGINGAGQIACLAVRNGVWHAVLLTPPGSTLTGSAISTASTVTLPGGSDATVTTTFATVVAGGMTSVTTSESGPTIPSGFQLPDPPVFFDVHTTASFSGAVQLCFSWTDGALHNEANARLLHYENGTWTDVTTSVDTQANIICGSVTSLSPFVIAELGYEFLGFEAPLLPDGSASIQQNKAGRTIPVKFQLSVGGQLTSSAVATIAVYLVLDVATGTVDTTDLTEDAGAANESSDLFRFDPGSNQYVYNLKTKGWQAPATYRIIVTLDDGSAHTVDFSLR